MINKSIKSTMKIKIRISRALLTEAGGHLEISSYSYS